MLTQTDISGTDDWYLMRLATELGQGFPRLGKLRSYEDGTITVPDGASGPMREAYARFVNMGRLNIARLITSAVTSRQVPVGFKTAAASDTDGDASAMAQWRRSHMATQSRDLFEDVSTYGAGFGMTGGDGLMMKLSPWNTVVDSASATPWDADASVVVSWDPVNQADVMTLFRRGYSRRAFLNTSVSTIPQNGTIWYPGRGWAWAEDPQPTKWANQIPVVQFLAPSGKGQFEPHTDTLDRINHTIFQRLVIVAMQAFRQRGIKGDLPREYPEDDPRAGQKINYDEIFAGGPAAMWMLPAGVDVWESQIAQIADILSAVDKDLKYVAAASSTPLYILSPDAAAGSAEGASLARETLVYKVEDLNARLNDSLAEWLALAFAAIGDKDRSDPALIETIWQPADRSSIAERAAAASQAVTSLPQKTIWRKVWQLTPSEIEQAEQDMDDQAFAGVSGGGQS